MQIAIYGKGGIGKSTVSANLSAALGACGHRVLQIGCDPKHDSTRLLHHGQKINTVLDYLLNTPSDEQRVSAVLTHGFADVCCVEAGGPRPGMGCAGRGILTAFDFLERHHVFSEFDTIVYDVLGDVVCGGFAVPVRRQYADAVFLVTSGEAMSIYAANNILQGIRNLSPGERRIAGIIYNSRGVGDEMERVERFARAVELPICARIPRSDAFARAEQEALTLAELAPESAEAKIFFVLTQKITKHLPLHEAKPLDEAQMETFMRGGSTAATRKIKPEKPVPVNINSALPAKSNDFIPAQKRALSDPFSRVPLYGCAFNGAVALAIHIKDVAILCHSSKNCIWFSNNGYTAYSRRGMFDRGMVYPAFIPRNLEATDITMQDAVFGGVAHAREKALKLVEKGARNIIAITSCIPGLSGDDLFPLKEELKTLGCDMYIVRTDGVEAGDYNKGMALCYKTIAREAIKRDVPKRPNAINIVYEHTISSQTDRNFETIKAILDALNIQVNCRFLCASSMEDIHCFLAAPYSIMARTDVLGNEIRKLFEEEYGCKFLPGALPRGFSETAEWIKLLGSLYGRETEAQSFIARQHAAYLRAIEQLRSAYQGKRVLISLNNGSNGWLLELAEDLGLNVVKLLIHGKQDDENPGWNRRFSAHWAGDREDLLRSVEELKPDILLTSEGLASELPEGLCVINILRDLSVGFFAGVDVAGEWIKIIENTVEGGWKRDRALFEKHFC